MAKLTSQFAREWTGKVPADPGDYLTQATPAARFEYLLGVDALMWQVALTMCQPALCFDGRQAAADTVRFSLVFPPASVNAVAYVTSWGDLSGAIQGDIDIDTTSSGSLGTSYSLTADADTIRIPAETFGTSTYGDLTAAKQRSVAPGGTNIDNAPSAVGNRQLELAGGKVRSVEDIEIKGCGGFGVCVTVRTEDLET